jgi:hypothetical protein
MYTFMDVAHSSELAVVEAVTGKKGDILHVT